MQVVLLMCGLVGGQVPALDLSTLGDEGGLAEVVWRHSPELAELGEQLGAAEGAVVRSLLLPNPTLDVGLNTLPVGVTNPPGLTEPFLEVPNLQLGLSWLVELGKRAPRQAAATHARAATRLQALELVRQRALDLWAATGEVGAAELRVEMLAAIANDAERLVTLAKARARLGDTAELDTERAQLDEERARTALGEAKESLAEALRQCGTLAGQRCLPFGDSKKAGAWLSRASAAPPDIEQRPDVAALTEATASAEAAFVLAKRQAIPDLTLRVGYVHDRFVISGNQQNSLFAGVSVPLPLFDFGQADAKTAQTAASAARRGRALTLAAVGPQLEGIEAQLSAATARRTRLAEQALPLARQLVERLELAVNRGGAPLSELLHSRRAQRELLMTANELEGRIFRLHIDRARVTGAARPPSELVERPPSE